MELISAHDAVEFLSKSAPRPWIKRMLLWMICSGELIPYFLKGRSIAKCSALAALLQGVDDGISIDEARTTVRSRFTVELAEKILAAKLPESTKMGEYVEVVAHEWGEVKGLSKPRQGIFCI